MSFYPVTDMNAIDGAIADLAARIDRPQGYPFSEIIVYSVCPEVEKFMPYVHYFPAENLPSMRKLDFKKAGKVFGNKVQEMKNDLSQVPDEYIITATRFEPVDEPMRKTTGCCKHLIEVECEDQEERWLVIEFRKAIKKYITEDLDIHIVPSIFGDKYPAPNRTAIARVFVDIIDCSEALYQALEKWGKMEFSNMPIRLRIPSRLQLYKGIHDNGAVMISDTKIRITI